MTRLSLPLATVVLVAAVALQATAAAAPARQADAYSSLAALYMKFGTVITGDKAKCARMTPDVAAWTTAHPQLKTLSAATAALPTLAHGQGQAKFKVQLHAEQVKIGAALTACKKNASFKPQFTLFRPLFYPLIVVLP